MRASSSAGSARGTSWKMPSRPSLSTFTSSQRLRASPADSALSSPNTHGWRSRSLAATPQRDIDPRPTAGLLARAARGTSSGRAGRRARRAASARGRPRAPRRRPRRPPRRCAARSTRGLRTVPRAFAAQHRRELEQRSRGGLRRLAREQRALGHRRRLRQAARERIGRGVGGAERGRAVVEADADAPPATRAAEPADRAARRAPACSQRLERRRRHELGLARAERHDQRARRHLGAVRHCVARDGRGVARREPDVPAELDLGRAELLRDALLTPLLLELLADLQLERGVERTRPRGQHRALCLDQVPAELRLGRLSRRRPPEA